MVYRVLSDFLLVHLFTGPKPKNVMAKLTTYLGRMPRTPAKFALGYTLCRQTGLLLQDYQRLAQDLEAMKDIPFDGDCISQGLMSSAFQPREELENGGNFETSYHKLSQAGKKFFLAQPPHVGINLPAATPQAGAFFLTDDHNATGDQPQCVV